MANKTNPRVNSPTRETILDAAETVVAKKGAGHLTIDAVSAQSELSKGGVLYHFPNKTSLLRGMITRIIDDVTCDINQAETKARAASAPVLPRIVQALCAHRKLETGASTGLLAASAEQPELLDPVRNFIEELVGRLVADAPDRVLALIALLAIDGLRFGEVLGLNYVSEKERAIIETRLFQLTEKMYS